MSRFALRARLPDGVRDTLGLDSDERVLAWGLDPLGAHVVATDRGLVVPSGAASHRLGWERVDTAVWDRETQTLTVVESAAAGQRPRRWPVRLANPGKLVDVVREQVLATVVLTRKVTGATNGPGILISARKVPGTDRMRWSVALDRGLDPTDPHVKSWIDEQVMLCKTELGG